MKSLTAVKVKANAHYTCQECGSTELIQAHHRIAGDDSTLIALCAECHSQKHPDIPKALFFATNNQPYWYNKSASSLAKELRVHPRTVIRTAKRLGISIGELSVWDEALIKGNIPKVVWGNKKRINNKQRDILSIMKTDDKFQAFVKRLRKKMKLSQTGLADLIGVDYVTVNRWENGKARPSQLAQRNLNRLARKAGVS